MTKGGQENRQKKNLILHGLMVRSACFADLSNDNAFIIILQRSSDIP